TQHAPVEEEIKLGTPATSSAQLERSPNAVDTNMQNAFTSVPAKLEVTQEINAFPRPYTVVEYGVAMRGMATPSQITSYGGNVMYQGWIPVQGSGPIMSGVTPVEYPWAQPVMAQGPGAMSVELAQPLSQESQNSLHILRDSLYPSQREWAAETLSALN